MRIAATQYSANYGALEVFISGCDGVCGCDCHNRELWDFSFGEDYRSIIPKIEEKVKDFSSLIKEVWITGGEPLLQKEEELVELLVEVKKTGKKMALFTRFDLEEIPEDIREYFDKIKSGKYEEEKVCENHFSEGILLVSENQKVFIRGRDY